MDEDIKYADFGLICRVCLLFRNGMCHISGTNLVILLEACASIQVAEEDDLPQQICEECIFKLQDAYQLKELCQNSDKRLREICETKHLAIPMPPMEEDPIYFEEDEDDVKLSILKEQKLNIEEANISEVKREFLKRENDDSDNESWHGEEGNYGGDYDESQDSTNSNLSLDSNGDEKPRKRKKHHNVRQYKCSTCGKKLDGVWRLALHMRKKHKAPPIKCSQCDQQFYHQLHLEEHLNNHDESLLRCKECNKQYPTLAKLKKHQVAHRPEMYHCFKCDCSFKGKFMLTKHDQIYHSGERPREACHICGKEVIRTNMKVHMKIHTERTPFECDECPKKFVRRITLIEHVMKKHKNQDIPLKQLCSVCGRGFRGKAEIRRHMRSHTGEKPFPCTLCDKRYREAKALRRHVSSAHMDERPFICEICTKGFHTKAILQAHMRTHTGERPFVCLVCNKAFGSKTWLRAHIKGHTDVKPS